MPTTAFDFARVFVAAAWLATLVGNSRALETRAVGNGRALLIAVGEFPRLREAYGEEEYARRIRLAGPANDAALMRRTLVDVLGFDDADVRSLVTPEATTLAALRRELDAFAERARAGELVVLYLSGHGSQQPDRDGDELDGLDEVFLASDAARMSATDGAIPGALGDDEIGAWVARVCARGARVWLVADSCHSGTLVRGGTPGVRLRGLEPADLGVAGHEQARGIERENALELPASGMVATFAASSHQRAPELEIDGAVHGLFTHTLALELALAEDELSFDELMRRLGARYAALPYEGCRPAAQGDLFASLRTGAAAARQLEVRRDGRDWIVDAGRLAALDRGTVLAVFEPGRRGDPEARLAHARVSRVSLDEARCRVERRDGDRGIPRGVGAATYPAVIVEHAPPARPLVVAGPADAELDDAVARSRGRVVRGAPEHADWHFEPGATRRLRSTAAGASRTIELGPGELGRRLDALFWRANLLALPALPGLGRMPHGLSVALLDDGGLARLDGGGPILPGSAASLAVANEGRTAWDLWVFAVDRVGGISTLFPSRTGSPTLAPGGHSRVPLVFDDGTIGREHVLALAFPAGAPSLRWLATDGRESTRGESAELSDLFARLATPAGPATRGLRIGNGAVTLIEYEVGWGEPDFARAWSLVDEKAGIEGVSGRADSPWIAAREAARVARPDLAGDVWILRDGATQAALFVRERAETGGLAERVRAADAEVELALVSRGGALEVWADLDHDGRPDVVRFDDDRDGRADRRRRRSGGAWIEEASLAESVLSVAELDLAPAAERARYAALRELLFTADRPRVRER